MDVTTRNEMPYPRPGDSARVTFGLIPAAVVACVILLTGMVTIPPRYIAHASFVVDWNFLRSAPNDTLVEKIRDHCPATYIAQVTGESDSEPEIFGMSDRTDDFSGAGLDKTGMLSGRQQRQPVTLARQTDDGDLFAIEAQDNDPGAAQAAANQVLQEAVSRLKVGIKTRSGPTAAHPLAATEPASLSNPDGTPFADPVKLVQMVQLERRSAGYGLYVLLMAVVAGGLAGALGLLLRLLIVVITALKIRTGSDGASLTRQPTPVPSRPIVIRPLPRFHLTGDLRESGI